MYTLYKVYLNIFLSKKYTEKIAVIAVIELPSIILTEAYNKKRP